MLNQWLPAEFFQVIHPMDILNSKLIIHNMEVAIQPIIEFATNKNER